MCFLAVDTVWHHATEIVAIVGILTSFAGIVGTWVRMQTKLTRLQEDFNKLLKNHTECSSQQQDRWEVVGHKVADACQRMELATISTSTKIKLLKQEFEDYIRWAKNGGEDHA